MYLNVAKHVLNKKVNFFNICYDVSVNKKKRRATCTYNVENIGLEQ
jgi:hypothetical protein